MKKRFAVLLMIAALLLSAVACTETTDGAESAVWEKGSALDDSLQTTAAQKATVTVGGAPFDIAWESSDAAAAFQALLPLTLTLRELNGNEKFLYLDEALPSQPESVGQIQAGDLMLYGNDCVVLFYKSFTTSYSYTRLGRITDPAGLADAVGAGDVVAAFSLD